jgi:hypothetical protein
VPGYAYPTSGRVLAVSKKLLEVTPEALEERRRKLEEDRPVSQSAYVTNPALARSDSRSSSISSASANSNTAAEKPEPATNPCGRRLDGTEMTDEERRRLGIGFCAKFDGGTAASFSVSLGRAATKETGLSHAIAVSLKDGNAQDVFAVKISQDTVYGTPIFTTMGGSSSCVGETATTRRDSRVTIKEIKPLCSKNDPATGYPNSPLCASSFDCECNNLAPGEDAFFSVILQNLSPWKTSVRYLLRAVNGGSMPWDSGKYARGSQVGCEDGDIGALEITAFGNKNLRDGSGIELIPLDYGQSEVPIRVKRPDFAPQCFSFKDLELELVSVCEDTDWDGNQDVYQYQAHMDHDTGAVSVVHPKFVGRPVGDACASGVTLDADTTSATGTTYHGNGTWCYSDLNLAVGCTESPKTCWETCFNKIGDLNNIKDVSMKAAAEAGCPTSFIQQTDDKGKKFECATIDGAFTLKAIDWEEVTGQCRCQHNCDCLVEDLYTYDVTKNEGDSGYETRETTTHLLTKNDVMLPEDDNNTVYCGLYTFTDASKANGPDTSRATFDVSWKNEVHGCRYELAANFDPRATKDDGSCLFPIPGCTYAAAGNYNPDATEDDESCVFGSQFAPRDVSGGSCMAGVDNPDALVSLYQYMIAKLAGVDPSDVKVDVTEVSSCGGNGRRRLSGAFEFSYTITTNPADTDAVQATMAGVTAEDIDAELKSQAAEDGVDLGGATTEGVREVTATPASSSEGGSASGKDGQDGLNSALGSGLAVGAILLLFLIVAAFYVYRWCEAQKAQKAEQDDRLREALRRATPGFRRQEERISCAAAEDANHDSNREDSESEGDLEKQPLRPDSGGLELRDMSKPTAYPGGQSLPPWPYPEAKPTARPTPASYDPACILRVSWPRDAARPTESFLRETFQALAPVRNVGLGSGNAAMVVFKDAAGMRAADAAYDGPWRVAPAKPAAVAADQPPPPPPPPPKTGEV